MHGIEAARRALPPLPLTSMCLEPVPNRPPNLVGGFSSACSTRVGSGHGGRQGQVQGCAQRARCLRGVDRPATVPTEEDRTAGAEVRMFTQM